MSGNKYPCCSYMPCPVLDMLKSISDSHDSKELSRVAAGELPKRTCHYLLISYSVYEKRINIFFILPLSLLKDYKKIFCSSPWKNCLSLDSLPLLSEFWTSFPVTTNFKTMTCMCKERHLCVRKSQSGSHWFTGSVQTNDSPDEQI